LSLILPSFNKFFNYFLLENRFLYWLLNVDNLLNYFLYYLLHSDRNLDFFNPFNKNGLLFFIGTLLQFVETVNYLFYIQNIQIVKLKYLAYIFNEFLVFFQIDLHCWLFLFCLELRLIQRSASAIDTYVTAI
jgi:hypothetical protein